MEALELAIVPASPCTIPAGTDDPVLDLANDGQSASCLDIELPGVEATICVQSNSAQLPGMKKKRGRKPAHEPVPLQDGISYVFAHSLVRPQCECNACGAACPSFFQLMEHYRKRHSVPKRSMRGSFLHMEALAEGRPKPCMTKEEACYVRAAPLSDSHFTCVVCNQVLHKSGAGEHFVQTHGKRKANVRQWLVVQDGLCVGREAANFARVRHSIADIQGAHMLPQATQHQPGCGSMLNNAMPMPEEAMGTGNDELACKTDLMLADIKSKIDKFMSNAPEIDFPHVWFSRECSMWSEDLRKGKNVFPAAFESDDYVSAEYEHYLLDTKEYSQSVVYERRKALGRLFGALRISACSHKHTIGDEQLVTLTAWGALPVLLGMQKSRVIPQMEKSNLFAAQRTWTNKMLVSLHCLIEFQMKQCRQAREMSNCEKVLQLLIDDMEHYHARSSSAKNTSNKKRQQYDATRLQRFPPDDIVKAAVKDCMLYLALLVRQWLHIARCDIPKHVLAFANTLVIGIVHLNGHAGRSKEWQIAQQDEVLDQLHKGHNYIVCKTHKTAYKYGDLAKWLAPGTIQALLEYCKLDPGHCAKLFKPLDEATAHVSISHYLKRFGAVFWPNAQHPTTNLLRKRLHTVLKCMAQTNQIMNLMERVDAHSAQVAQSVYCCTTPKQDAELVEAVFKHAHGEPVAWPSEHEQNAKASVLSKKLKMLLGRPDLSTAPENEPDVADSDDEEDGSEFKELAEKYKAWVAKKMACPALQDVGVHDQRALAGTQLDITPVAFATMPPVLDNDLPLPDAETCMLNGCKPMHKAHHGVRTRCTSKVRVPQKRKGVSAKTAKNRYRHLAKIAGGMSRKHGNGLPIKYNRSTSCRTQLTSAGLNAQPNTLCAPMAKDNPAKAKGNAPDPNKCLGSNTEHCRSALGGTEMSGAACTPQVGITTAAQLHDTTCALPSMPGTEPWANIAPYKTGRPRTRIILTGYQKAWAVNEVRKYVSATGIPPDKAWYNLVLWKSGVHNGVWDALANPEGIRTHCRKHV